jgi:rhodanese-related sulfurtransferase
MMTKREYKASVYDQLERIGKALASGPRIELLDLLCQGARTVESLANEVGQSLANTSHHLKALRQARLVETERRGAYVLYSIADDHVATVLCAMRCVAEARLLEVRDLTRRVIDEPESLDRVARDALIERVRNGEVTLIDVRPEEEYRAGHIPGAISMPLSFIEERLRELPRDRDVVAYCRGPYCLFAVDAVRALRAHGFRAVRMDEGVPEWRARGLPVAKEAA